MITPAYARTMARYNRWQNQSLYGGAERLPDSERARDVAAFFGSIHATLAHILWADMTWMHRFAPRLPPAPSKPSDGRSYLSLWPDWTVLKHDRHAFDTTIIGWADGLEPADLSGDLTWTSSDGLRTSTAARALLVTHFFNHQAHHRGQVHCMLTQVGIKPDDTDLMLLRE